MKKIVILSFGLASITGMAQNTYIDPTTTGALMIYSGELKKQQKETREKIVDLTKAQATVTLAMTEVKKVQDKVYKGLSEVSGTLTNGLQVKEIYSDLKRIQKYSDEVIRLARTHPQYAVFATEVAKMTQRDIINSTAEVSEMLTGGNLNLMTAGDRYKLLEGIHSKIKRLKLDILSIKIILERAERIGFWKMINPFQRYINTDQTIVENILRKHRWLKR